MDCKGGNPVSAQGVDLAIIVDCSQHLEVAFKPCVSGDLLKQKINAERFISVFLLTYCLEAVLLQVCCLHF